jgi:Tol biopolymer transport system component/DNA-binding winged helix-turn-helix (wHTH) protein
LSTGKLKVLNPGLICFSTVFQRRMSEQIKHFYEFGSFRIDTVNRLLLHHGEPVPLKAKAIDTLLFLVEHRGEVVEKDDLMAALWPDSFVEEGNLTQNIYVLRKALGETRYIETIPRRGYRFAGEVKEWDDPAAELILIKEKTRTSVSYEEEIEQEVPESNAVLMPNHQTAIEVTPRASPAPTNLKSPRRSRLANWPWPVLAVIVIVIVIAGVFVWRRAAKPPFETVKLARLTTTGNALKAAISPDGKYLAHVEEDAGQKSIWLRQVATSKDLQIVPPARTTFFYGLTFSHDGNYIYYVNQEMNRVGTLFRVSSLGGAPIMLIEDVDSPVTISPDDQRLAFIRGSPGVHSIIIANVDGTGEQKLSSTKQSESPRIGPTWMVPPAWSPDGKIVACPVAITGTEGEYQTVWGFQLADGVGHPLSSAHWAKLGRFEWLADQTGLLATAAEQKVNPAQQVWFIPYPQGPARKVTNDLSDYHDLSLTTDGKTLLAIQTERKANIWMAPAADINRGTQLTFTNYDGSYGLSWTPDNKVVYTLETAGEQNLWLTDPDRKAPRQLTAHAGFNEQPAVSPDGRYVVFVSNRTRGLKHLWRIDIDGQHPLELTTGPEDTAPSFTPDSKWIVFTSYLASGGARISRVAINGGEAVHLTEKVSGEPNVSPDGTLIACFYRTDPAGPNQMGVLPVAGGDPKFIRDLPAHYGRFCWTSDGRALSYADKQSGVGNIWIQPLDGSPPKQLTNWKPDPLPAFEWSRDGKWLAYAVGSITSDVVLISDTRR